MGRPKSSSLRVVLLKDDKEELDV